MSLYYNNNEMYGDCGPFEAESKEDLADEMTETFESWADEEIMRLRDLNGVWPARHVRFEIIEQLREDFINVLDEL